MSQQDDFPDKTRSICTAEAPMPSADKGRWYHPDAKCDSGGYNGPPGSVDYWHYTCPNCGKAFYVGLPEAEDHGARLAQGPQTDADLLRRLNEGIARFSGGVDAKYWSEPVRLLREARERIAQMAEGLAAEHAKFEHWNGTDVPSLNIALNNARQSCASLNTRAERAEVQLAQVMVERDAKEATIMAVVHTVGGVVEGAPTHRGNFLQRLRQLTEAEGTRAPLLALVERWRARAQQIRDIGERDVWADEVTKCADDLEGQIRDRP